MTTPASPCPDCTWAEGHAPDCLAERLRDVVDAFDEAWWAERFLDEQETSA